MNVLHFSAPKDKPIYIISILLGYTSVWVQLFVRMFELILSLRLYTLLSAERLHLVRAAFTTSSSSLQELGELTKPDHMAILLTDIEPPRNNPPLPFSFPVDITQEVVSVCDGEGGGALQQTC